MATSQELIQQLQAKGFSSAAIGRAVGRDSSLIGQIAKGAKPGRNLTQSLGELLVTGEIRTAPHRRTASNGTLAKIRASRGQESVVPQVPQGQRIRTVTRSTEQPQHLPKPAPKGVRNKLTHTEQRLPNGRELIRVTVPKSDRSDNRQAGAKIVSDAVGRAVAAGKRLSGTVWAEVTRKNGTRERIPIPLGGHGGYAAQSASDAIAATPGGAFNWLNDQVAKRYPEFEGGFRIVGFDLDVW